MRKLFILIFILFQMQLAVAQNNIMPLRYAGGTTYVLKDDMTAVSLVSATNWCFATVSGQYFYHRLNDHTLTQYSLSDLSTMNDTLYSQWQTPFVVDKDDSLWCYYADSLFVWASDLSSMSRYKLPDGSGADITFAALSIDNNYVYTCETTNDSLYKFSRATLRAGSGSAEWGVKVYTGVTYLAVTEGDTVLLFGNTNIVYYDGSNGDSLDVENGGNYATYCYNNYKIYSPMHGYGSEDRKIFEYGLAGDTTGKAPGLGEDTYCAAISVTGDTLFVGIYAYGSNGDAGVFAFDVTGDWGFNEVALDTFQVLDDQSHYFRGDPTGYIHSKMVAAAGGGASRKNVLVIH